MIFQLFLLFNTFSLLNAFNCSGPSNGYCTNGVCNKPNCGGFGSKDYCGCGDSSKCPVSAEALCNPHWATDCSCATSKPPHIVSLTNVYVNNGDCCYVYKSTKKDNWCDGSSDPLSYWMMESVDCPSVSNYTNNAVEGYTSPVELVDPALCMYGLKFNSPCSNQCTYQMCVKFDGLTATDSNQCKTSPGWYAVRGSNQVDYGTLERPACPPHHSDYNNFDNGYCGDIIRLHYGTTVKRKLRLPKTILDGIVVKGNVHLNCSVLDSSGTVVFSHSGSFGCSFLEEDGFDRDTQYFLFVDQGQPCKDKKGYFRIKCIECQRRIYRKDSWWTGNALSSHFKSLKNFHLSTNHSPKLLITFSSIFTLFILSLF